MSSKASAGRKPLFRRSTRIFLIEFRGQKAVGAKMKLQAKWKTGRRELVTNSSETTLQKEQNLKKVPAGKQHPHQKRYRLSHGDRRCYRHNPEWDRPEETGMPTGRRDWFVGITQNGIVLRVRYANCNCTDNRVKSDNLSVQKVLKTVDSSQRSIVSTVTFKHSEKK